MPRRQFLKFKAKDDIVTVFFGRGKAAGKGLGRSKVVDLFRYNPIARPKQGPVTRTGRKPITALEAWRRRM